MTKQGVDHRIELRSMPYVQNVTSLVALRMRRT